MNYKVTGRDWINMIAAVGVIVGLVALSVVMVLGVEPVEKTVKTPEVAFANRYIIEAEVVQLTDPDSTLTETEPIEEIDIPEVTEYVEPEPEYTPEPTNPPETTATEPQECPSEPVEAPESDELSSDEYSEEVEMLAAVIYQEAGSDSICQDCRYYVADIVLNRVNDSRFPDTIHGVLTQEGQYGRFAWTGVVWPERAGYSSEAHAVERAYQVAQDVLNGNHSSLYGNGYVWQAGFVQGSDGFWCCGHYYARG